MIRSFHDSYKRFKRRSGTRVAATEIRMIDLPCRGAARHGRPVGVCGGLASDPAAAALLVGLGVTELSCTPAAVHDVKAAIRQVDLAACRKLASAALELAHRGRFATS